MTLTSTPENARLDRLEGLTAYLRSTPTRPELPDPRDYATWDDSSQRLFDEQRARYLAVGIVIGTPQLVETVHKVQTTMVMNRHRVSGRSGVMISGDSTMGKTTAALAAMRSALTRYRRQYPDADANGHVPVVYFEVPAAATAKGVMQRLSDFLGLPQSTRETFSDLHDSIADFLNDAGTQLVVVDEIHHLSGTARATADAADILKSLSNKVPATFIYAGINIHTGGLLSGDRGRQISGRFALTNLTRYGFGSTADKRRWRDIIRAFESSLCLFDHHPGDLDGEAKWLHDRSGGAIGTLAHLLTGCAQLLINEHVGPDKERVTRALLETVPIDFAAECRWL
jgi:hypothetical protein